MSEDNYNDLVASVKRIENALVGDKTLGHQGLVYQVSDHDRRIGALERGALWLAGAAGAISLLWVVGTQLLSITGKV